MDYDGLIARGHKQLTFVYNHPEIFDEAQRRDALADIIDRVVEAVLDDSELVFAAYEEFR